MGEAKQRGRYEERVESALGQPGHRKLRLANPDDVTHFATIMDHSAEAKDVVELTRRTFPELQADVWSRFDDGYEFLIVVKGKNRKDQGTMLTLNVDTLIAEGIPQILSKVASVGGKCGFFLAVAPALVDRLAPLVGGFSRSVEGPAKRNFVRSHMNDAFSTGGH